MGTVESFISVIMYVHILFKLVKHWVRTVKKIIKPFTVGGEEH